MPEFPEFPPRPLPQRGAGDTVREWLRWFGVGRLLITAISVMCVVGGGVWLLKTPTPPAEAGLPVVSAAGQPSGSGPASTPTATLQPPTPSTDPPPPTTVPAPAVIVVHVAGAVAQPGIYQLMSDARVADAVGAAGGAAADGDLDGVNLAAALVDGERVYVPRVGEVDPATVPSGAHPAASGGTPADTVPAGPVDLNMASVEQLETLTGVGPATAAAIVEDREANGPFASVDDLDRVPGIGPAKLEALRPDVTV